MAKVQAALDEAREASSAFEARATAAEARNALLEGRLKEQEAHLQVRHCVRVCMNTCEVSLVCDVHAFYAYQNAIWFIRQRITLF